jgi:hypothetical protein
MKDWPLVVVNDDGIRPAGPPDACFYCGRTIGQPHGQDCAVVTKRIRVRYVFELDIEVPHHWTEADVMFHRNESTWCADNAIDAIEEHRDENGCLCSSFTCEYIGVADDMPTRLIYEPITGEKLQP